MVIRTKPPTPLPKSFRIGPSSDPNMDRTRTGPRIVHQVMWISPLAAGDRWYLPRLTTKHDNTNGPAQPKPITSAKGTTGARTQSLSPAIHGPPSNIKKTHCNQKRPEGCLMGRSHGSKVEPPRPPSTRTQQHSAGDGGPSGSKKMARTTHTSQCQRHPKRHPTFRPPPGTATRSRQTMVSQQQSGSVSRQPQQPRESNRISTDFQINIH